MEGGGGFCSPMWQIGLKKSIIVQEISMFIGFEGTYIWVTSTRTGCWQNITFFLTKHNQMKAMLFHIFFLALKATLSIAIDISLNNLFVLNMFI